MNRLSDLDTLRRLLRTVQRDSVAGKKIWSDIVAIELARDKECEKLATATADKLRSEGLVVRTWIGGALPRRLFRLYVDVDGASVEGYLEVLGDTDPIRVTLRSLRAGRAQFERVRNAASFAAQPIVQK